MASVIEGAVGRRDDYRGLPSIFEFVNWDGELTRWNCGQAAAATLIAHRGLMPSQKEASLARFREIEKRFPPDQLGGWLGTGRRQVVALCKAFAVHLRVAKGEEELRAQLSDGRPVIVMLGVPGGKFLGFDLPGGHWMVAYGFDDEQVYLTNWGTMPWSEFRRRWRSIASRFIGMCERGLYEPSSV